MSPPHGGLGSTPSDEAFSNSRSVGWGDGVGAVRCTLLGSPGGGLPAPAVPHRQGTARDPESCSPYCDGTPAACKFFDLTGQGRNATFQFEGTPRSFAGRGHACLFVESGFCCSLRCSPPPFDALHSQNLFCLHQFFVF